MASPRADSYTAGSGAEIGGGRFTALAISDSYERSSIDMSLSSISGVGDAATITLRPRLFGDLWMEPSARVHGVNGKRPTFKFTDNDGTAGGYSAFYQRPWQSTRRPMFSYNMVDWTYFDTQTLSGNQIIFRHNTAFTSGTVYIGRSRQMSVHGAGDWIASLSATYPAIVSPTISAAAFTPTADMTGYAAQDYIADEFGTQTDAYGRTVPKTPFYAVKLSDASLAKPGGGVKSLFLVASGVHAGEDVGNSVMKAFIHKLLDGSADSVFILSRFDILLYPMMNAPGRAGGSWRGAWQTASNGDTDLNRAYHLTPAGIEIVDKTKAVITADRAGGTQRVVIDFHGSYEIENWGLYTNTAALATFRTTLATISGQTIRDDGVITNASFSQSIATGSTQLSMTHEANTDSPVSEVELVAHAGHLMASLASLINAGTITP